MNSLQVAPSPYFSQSTLPKKRKQQNTDTHKQKSLREMKESCELCGDAARIYCESDQASLCRDCDEKVHCANFLVAKHCRSLLCQVCQSPTPWTASGPRLGHAGSVCESCFSVHKKNDGKFKEGLNGDCPKESRGEDGESEYGGNELDDASEDYDDDDGEEEEEEEGDIDDEEGEDVDNQIVPWSDSASSSTIHIPPPATSFSSEEQFSNGLLSSGGGLKRTRDDNDSKDGRSSSHLASRKLITREGRRSYSGSIRPLKQPRVDDHGEVEDSWSSAV